MTRIGWFSRLDPWTEMDSLRRRMNDLLGAAWPGWEAPEVDFPPLNLTGAENEFRLTAELPGMKMEEIDLSITGDMLTIRGERKPEPDADDAAYHRRERSFGPFVRSLQLPDRVVLDKAEARYVNGVLEVRIPKAPEAQTRRVAIQSA